MVSDSIIEQVFDHFNVTLRKQDIQKALPLYVIKGMLRDTGHLVSNCFNRGDQRLDDFYLHGDEEEPPCPTKDSLFEPSLKDSYSEKPQKTKMLTSKQHSFKLQNSKTGKGIIDYFQRMKSK